MPQAESRTGESIRRTDGQLRSRVNSPDPDVAGRIDRHSVFVSGQIVNRKISCLAGSASIAIEQPVVPARAGIVDIITIAPGVIGSELKFRRSGAASVFHNFERRSGTRRPDADIAAHEGGGEARPCLRHLERRPGSPAGAINDAQSIVRSTRRIIIYIGRILGGRSVVDIDDAVPDNVQRIYGLGHRPDSFSL